MKKSTTFDLFSDSEEELDYVPRQPSDSDRRRSTQKSASESDSKKKKGGSKKSIEVKPSDDVPESYIEIDKTRVGTLGHNTIIQYRKMNGKLIESKYFKKIDNIAGTIILGFYTHDKKNYSESLNNIKAIYVHSKQGGSDNMLKETIEIQKKDWNTLRRDMIISYQKLDNQFIYKAKFNSYTKATDGSTRFSLTSERGYNFTANPDNIQKIYRHVTSNDKTLTFILEALRKLENRVRALEQKQ